MLPRRAKDSDTDPSTPEALRAPGVDTDPGLGPGGRAASTNPGLGGPPPPLVTVTPMSVPVQTPVAAGAKKDSVELLLEGMPLQQPPPPPRTTPQTAGQSSAAYHVEHSVRPAHTSPDDMPKVVVERAPQHATVRLDRARLQAVIDQAQAEKAALAQQREQAQQQAAGMPMSLRIAIAIVAGLAVVLANLPLRATDRERRHGGAPPAPASRSRGASCRRCHRCSDPHGSAGGQRAARPGGHGHDEPRRTAAGEHQRRPQAQAAVDGPRGAGGHGRSGRVQDDLPLAAASSTFRATAGPGGRRGRER